MISSKCLFQKIGRYDFIQGFGAYSREALIWWFYVEDGRLVEGGRLVERALNWGIAVCQLSQLE